MILKHSVQIIGKFALIAWLSAIVDCSLETQLSDQTAWRSVKIAVEVKIF